MSTPIDAIETAERQAPVEIGDALHAAPPRRQRRREPPAASTARVAEVHRVLELHDEQLALVVRQRAVRDALGEAIRAALRNGWTATRLASVVGVSRQRIDQLAVDRQSETGSAGRPQRT